LDVKRYHLAAPDRGTGPLTPADELGIRQERKGHPQWDAWGRKMIEKTVKKLDLKSDSSIKEDLAYWLRKTPRERIAAIEFLRRQYHGRSARLQRCTRVVQQTQG
jgi:hypothetical protein